MTLSDDTAIDRRHFLAGSALLAGMAAGDLRAFATARDTDQRLVVIVLRGAMDGLHVVPPHGDPHFAAMRAGREVANGGIIDLDGFFGLDAEMGDLLPLWRGEELGFVHAVSSPYRSRSHFDGQDALENGTASADGSDSGWLNRAIAALPPRPGAPLDPRRFAVNVGTGAELILRGALPVGVWHPRADLEHDAEVRLFHQALYENHPHFEKAYSEALLLDGEGALARRGERDGEATARLAARLLREEARAVAFSINGWDTHLRIQNAAKAPMRALARALLSLRAELGEAWTATTVVAISEFGRTVRLNGSKGTDHGTGGVMMVAGGGARGHGGGRVLSDWPGLGEGQLFEDRDLMPTEDVRRFLAWTLARTLDVPRPALERIVFPGLQMGNDPFRSRT